MLINNGMDAGIDTGLQLIIYGWALCFAYEDRQKNDVWSKEHKSMI